jgi:sugar phosphate isomerase/epimerase
MRLACSTFPYQGLPLTGALRRMHELGFRFADVVLNADPRWGHIQPDQVLHDPLPVLEQLEEAEGRSGVKIAAFNLAFEAGSLSERGQFEACCKLARRLRVPVVNVVAGNGDELVEYRRLRDFHALARDCEVTLCVETFVPSIFQEPKMAAELADGLRGVRLTLDTGHLLSQGYGVASWQPLYHHVGHVHLWAAVRPPAHAENLPGDRGLEVPALLAELAQVGYAGTLTIEYIGTVGREGVRFDPEEEIRALRDRLIVARPELKAVDPA